MGDLPLLPPLLDNQALEEFYRRVGRALEQARRRRSRSQRQLAEALRLSRPSVTNIEKGKQRITLHHVWAAAALLRVGLEDLLPRPEEFGEKVKVAKEADQEKRPAIERALEELKEEITDETADAPNRAKSRGASSQTSKAKAAGRR